MNPNLYVLLEGGLFFGGVLALCWQQLRSTDRAIKQRIAREQAQKEASEGK